MKDKFLVFTGDDLPYSKLDTLEDVRNVIGGGLLSGRFKNEDIRVYERLPVDINVSVSFEMADYLKSKQ
jgi:hypothetical protein